MDASDSLPHAAALHPTLPGPDRFRIADAAEEANDYTANAPDLARYSVSVFEQSDSLPKQGGAGKFVRLHSYFDKNKNPAAPVAEDDAEGNTDEPTPVPTAGTPTVERLGKRPSSSQDGEKATATKTGIAAGGAEGAGEGPRRSPSRSKVTIVAPGEEGKEVEEIEIEEGAASGPLYGVHPIQRSTSYAKEGEGGEGDEGGGPMHFATSKARQGAKSLAEISNLFRRKSNDPDDDDDGGATDDVEGGLRAEVGDDGGADSRRETE